MEQQKWTIKQVLFEKEMNEKYKIFPLYINGFTLPQDKDLLLKAVDEIFEVYPNDESKESIKYKIEQLYKYCAGSPRAIRVFKEKIKIDYQSYRNYPMEKELMFFPKSETKTYKIEGLGGTIYQSHNIFFGLHIHKDCLEIGD